MLTVVVLLLVAGNVAGLISALVSPESFPEARGGLGRAWGLYLLCPVLALAGLAAIWHWRRWGVWLTLGAALLTFVLEGYAQVPGLKLLRVPVGALLLLFAVRPVRGHLA